MVGGTRLFEGTCSEELVKPLLDVLELFGNLGKGIIEERVKGSSIQVGPNPTFTM